LVVGERGSYGGSTASMAFRTRSDVMMPLEARLAIREALVEPEERQAMAGGGCGVEALRPRIGNFAKSLKGRMCGAQ